MRVQARRRMGERSPMPRKTPYEAEQSMEGTQGESKAPLADKGRRSGWGLCCFRNGDKVNPRALVALQRSSPSFLIKDVDSWKARKSWSAATWS
jgi:hypothetical protein